MDWTDYPTAGLYDELIDDGRPRAGLGAASRLIDSLTLADLQERQAAAEVTIRSMGITFTVYEDGTNIDRAWPFDVLPRILAADEWARTAAGLTQRMAAMNLFIADLYGDQKIVADGVFPAELLEQSANFRPECVGVTPPHGTWAHISGSDLVRSDDGVLHVLEDNLRIPSGVSYMLENRSLTKRVFPELFHGLDIAPVDDYPHRLAALLASLSPRQGIEPTVAVLTPGVYNSAYFEHAFLAQQMGAHLVEGHDLVVDDDDCVAMRTVDGLARVDVIYRRVDDLYLDPEVFLPHSTLGVAGLMRAWRAGNVAIANAPGAGVADDKAVYAFVPAIIEYYLGEEPGVPNVPTMLCMDDGQRAEVLANLGHLVVKPTNESGGYGIFIGPHATAAEQELCRAQILADPRNFVAQPVLNLSTVPTLCDGRLAPRHVDLRPFILSGDHPFVTNGGLTRVALKEGSLVVNSSQGGGSKDTWVVDVDV